MIHHTWVSQRWQAEKWQVSDCGQSVFVTTHLVWRDWQMYAWVHSVPEDRSPAARLWTGDTPEREFAWWVSLTWKCQYMSSMLMSTVVNKTTCLKCEVLSISDRPDVAWHSWSWGWGTELPGQWCTAQSSLRCSLSLFGVIACRGPPYKHVMRWNHSFSVKTRATDYCPTVWQVNTKITITSTNRITKRF